jgi:hypothetical protein
MRARDVRAYENINLLEQYYTTLYVPILVHTSIFFKIFSENYQLFFDRLPLPPGERMRCEAGRKRVLSSKVTERAPSFLHNAE